MHSETMVDEAGEFEAASPAGVVQFITIALRAGLEYVGLVGVF